MRKREKEMSHKRSIAHTRGKIVQKVGNYLEEGGDGKGKGKKFGKSFLILPLVFHLKKKKSTKSKIQTQTLEIS